MALIGRRSRRSPLADVRSRDGFSVLDFVGLLNLGIDVAPDRLIEDIVLVEQLFSVVGNIVELIGLSTARPLTRRELGDADDTSIDKFVQVALDRAAIDVVVQIVEFLHARHPLRVTDDIGDDVRARFLGNQLECVPRVEAVYVRCRSNLGSLGHR